MEMVSKVHHCGVSRQAKVVSRRMLERVMEKPLKPTRSKKRVLEVHVMFEPSRLAEQSLQEAYACLIPTVRRRLRQATPIAKPMQQSLERKVQ
jgi:hypothetical protein